MIFMKLRKTGAAQSISAHPSSTFYGKFSVPYLVNRAIDLHRDDEIGIANWLQKKIKIIKYQV